MPNTEYLVRADHIVSKITVSNDGTEPHIISTEPQLARFKGATLSALRKWLYKIDKAYKIEEQGRLF